MPSSLTVDLRDIDHVFIFVIPLKWKLILFPFLCFGEWDKNKRINKRIHVLRLQAFIIDSYFRQVNQASTVNVIIHFSPQYTNFNVAPICFTL